MDINSTDKISTTFHPHALLVQGIDPDVVFVSSDGVYFYAHQVVLCSVSSNTFGGLVVDSSMWNLAFLPIQLHYLHVPDDAAALNVVLHAAYGLSLRPYSPDLATLLRAADAGLRRYGLLPIYVGAPLTDALLAHAQRGPDHALDIYTLAARHHIESLAVSASIYMHGLDLSTITDQRADFLGGVYLRRLFMLVLSRTAALKRMLMIAPEILHPPTVLCGPKDRRRDVSGPWAVAVSQLMVHARADIPVARLEATLNPLLLRCACGDCRTVIQNRIRAIIVEWLEVKRTI